MGGGGGISPSVGNSPDKCDLSSFLRISFRTLVEHWAVVNFVHFRKKLTRVGGDDGVQLLPDVLEQLAGGCRLLSQLVTILIVVFTVHDRLLWVLGVETGKPPGDRVVYSRSEIDIKTL